MTSNKLSPLRKPEADNMKMSVDRIVNAAMIICESEGFEAISMRKLAKQLRVTAMALYKHVSTKHDLLNLIADRYLQLVTVKQAPPGKWRDSIFDVYSALRALIAEKPVLAHILITQPLDGSTAHKIAELLLAILRDAGFSNEETSEMTTVFVSFTVGFTLQDMARRDSPDTQARIKQLKSLQQYPNLRSAAEHLVTWHSDDYFKSGLEALIDSYGRRLRPKSTKEKAQ